VPMPAALVACWTAWNEAVLGLIRGHLDLAVTESIEWNDPRDSFVGIDELEAAVKRLRSSEPEHVFNVASEIDHHRDRLRYRWEMTRNGRTLMRDSTSTPSTRRPISSPESTVLRPPDTTMPVKYRKRFSPSQRAKWLRRRGPSQKLLPRVSKSGCPVPPASARGARLPAGRGQTWPDPEPERVVT
jgi:hypothetical protein